MCVNVKRGGKKYSAMRFWYLDNILYMCLCVRECQHSHARYGNSTLSSSTHCHEGLEGMRPSALLASTNRTPISVTIVIGIRKPAAVYSFSVRYFFYTNGNFASVIANQHMCAISALWRLLDRKSSLFNYLLFIPFKNCQALQLIPE